MDERVLKTKIRRLYDIANVLQSIGLIKKTHKSTNRKPAFRWIGIDGVHIALSEILQIVDSSQNPNQALHQSAPQTTVKSQLDFKK